MPRRKRPRHAEDSGEAERVVQWESFEVVLRTSGRKPFQEELFSGDDPSPAIAKMLLLQDHGWGPTAHASLVIERADGKTPEIWILKCKPSCWRLYFRVYPSGKIVYLHAKCKKKWKQNPQDSATARGRFESLGGAGGNLIDRFPFPGK